MKQANEPGTMKIASTVKSRNFTEALSGITAVEN